MATVTRTILREPSNSKVPGATRHLSIANERFVRGVAELPEGAAVIKIAGTFMRASGRGDRVAVEIPVVVTGNEADTLTGVCDGGSQRFEILFAGVRAA